MKIFKFFDFLPFVPLDYHSLFLASPQFIFQRIANYLPMSVLALVSGLMISPTASGELPLTFTRIVDTKTPVPGGKGSFSFLALPYIDSQEGEGHRLVFEGFSRRAGSEDLLESDGIYIAVGNKLSKIVDQTTPVPLGGTNTTFQSFGSKLAVYGGKVAFSAYSAEGHNGAYLAASSKNVQRIADESTLVPNGSGTFNQFGPPSISENGSIAFWANDKFGLEGIFYAHDGELKVWTDTTTVENFSSFGYEPSLNNGVLLFTATTSANRSGVYMSFGLTHPVVTIADSTKLTRPIARSFYPRLGRLGKFVILGVSPEIALYKGQVSVELGSNPSNSLTKIVGADTHIPRGSGNFSRIEMAAIDPKTGNIAFVGIGTNDKRGIYIYLSNKNVIEKIIDMGDLLDGKPLVSTSLSVVAGLDMSNGALNGDSLVFLASFSDNPSDVAIYRVDGIICGHQNINSC